MWARAAGKDPKLLTPNSTAGFGQQTFLPFALPVPPMAATVHPSLAWRTGPFGAGGFATAPIPPGTCLLSLPYPSILSETYAEATLHGSTAVALLRPTRPLEATGRVILYHYHRSARPQAAAQVP